MQLSSRLFVTLTITLFALIGCTGDGIKLDPSQPLSVLDAIAPYYLQYEHAESNEQKSEIIQLALKDLAGFDGDLSALVASYTSLDVEHVVPSTFVMIVVSEAMPDATAEVVLHWSKVVTALLTDQLIGSGSDE
jgi:hypothetical protein